MTDCPSYCPAREGGDHDHSDPFERPARRYQAGDRVTVHNRASCFHRARGVVRAVVGTYADGYTASVRLDDVRYGGVALPFAPSELDLTEIGDRLADDAGANWRVPA